MARMTKIKGQQRAALALVFPVFKSMQELVTWLERLVVCWDMRGEGD